MDLNEVVMSIIHNISVIEYDKLSDEEKKHFIPRIILSLKFEKFDIAGMVKTKHERIGKNLNISISLNLEHFVRDEITISVPEFYDPRGKDKTMDPISSKTSL